MIAEQITRLLVHYWTADDDAVSRRAQIEDWIEDLAEFGPHAVADACTEWRRSSGKRPTPSDIRKLCREGHAERRPERLLEAPPPLDELDAAAIADRWAQDRGFAGIADFQAQNFVGASIRTRDGRMRFPGLRQISPREASDASAPTAAALGVEAREIVGAETAGFRLPPADDPRVVARMREMGVSA